MSHVLRILSELQGHPQWGREPYSSKLSLSPECNSSIVRGTLSYLTSPTAVLVPLARLFAAADDDESVEAAAARSSGLTPLYSTPARTPTKGRKT